jgi:hypothetical protein
MTTNETNIEGRRFYRFNGPGDTAYLVARGADHAVDLVADLVDGETARVDRNALAELTKCQATLVMVNHEHPIARRCPLSECEIGDVFVWPS